MIDLVLFNLVLIVFNLVCFVLACVTVYVLRVLVTLISDSCDEMRRIYINY